ncbi:MAG: hypothetical protein Q8K22_08450 [Rhodoferax sp.]|nr:hypothetical protein [Rhodoferax sp.]
MNATNTLLLWNSQTDDVLLKPWPELDRRHGGYRSGLACYTVVQKASFEHSKTIVSVETMHCVVRDGTHTQKLHATLLGLSEYRDAYADDMPEVNRHD